MLKLIIREMQIKTTMSYHFIPLRLAKIRKLNNGKSSQEWRQPPVGLGGLGMDHSMPQHESPPSNEETKHPLTDQQFPSRGKPKETLTQRNMHKDVHWGLVSGEEEMEAHRAGEHLHPGLHSME